MKKDEFKKSIDNINPDAYMGNRIKAKINSNIPVRNNRRVTVSITAFCLAFAIMFGVTFLTAPTAPTEQTTTDSTVTQERIVSPFIIVANAADVQNTEAGAENKALELNEEYPYEMFLKVKDTTNLSDEQKEEFVLDLAGDFEEYGFTGKEIDTVRAMVYGDKNVTVVEYAFNTFKLDLEDDENIKSVNVKNTSKYGQIVFDENKPVFDVPEHGNEVTINGEDFDFEKSSFYWQSTEEMEEAFFENINTPFSTFNDTITFTVEYNDGSKAIGVVDLIFDDGGNAKVVCRKYEYVS